MKTVPLKKVATFAGGGTPSRAKPEYFGGDIPWVKTTDLNNGLITSTEETLSKLGLKKSSCSVIPANSVLVAMYGGFRQIGRTGLLAQPSAINQALTAVLPDEDQLHPMFLLEWLNFHVGHWRRLAGSSRKDPNITKNDVADFPVPVLPVEYQEKVVALLQAWDEGIAHATALQTSADQRQRGLMQQLLTGRQRLPGFTGEWKSVRVGSFATDVRIINVAARSLPVLSCTKYSGLVDSLQYFGKQVFSQNTATYKIVRRGQFAYATNHIEEGSIGYQNLHDEALISPMYTVFEADPNVVDHDYLFLLLKTEAMRRVFEATTHASVDRRGSLRWPEFSKLSIRIPSLQEQKALVRVMHDAQEAVSAAEGLLNALQQQKRALLQRLLGQPTA